MAASLSACSLTNLSTERYGSVSTVRSQNLLHRVPVDLKFVKSLQASPLIPKWEPSGGVSIDSTGAKDSKRRSLLQVCPLHPKCLTFAGPGATACGAKAPTL